MLAHLEVGVIRRKIVNRYMTSYNLLGNFAKITDTFFVYNGQWTPLTPDCDVHT